MAQKFELRRGFLRMQRLGPVKFGDQSRWSVRAPESTGLWAFPFPHFDIFYAYHRYRDMLPKGLRDRYPKDLKWWRRTRLPSEAAYGGEHAVVSEYEDGDYPLESYADIEWDDGFPVNCTVISEYFRAQENWIETVGKKILPLREFWYRGELYTHFNRDGSVGGWTMGSQDEGNEWTLMSTDELARHMRSPGGVVAADGHRPDGRPATYSFSKDHLEVFIPRGQGTIRDRI